MNQTSLIPEGFKVPELVCPECGAAMRLRDSRYGKFYGCVRFPACRATHGAHQTGKPLGIPVNKETRELRIRAHEMFDLLWMKKIMVRQEAYRWMQKKMKLTKEKAHIGCFDKQQCEQLMNLLGTINWEDTGRANVKTDIATAFEQAQQRRR